MNEFLIKFDILIKIIGVLSYLLSIVILLIGKQKIVALIFIAITIIFFILFCFYYSVPPQENEVKVMGSPRYLKTENTAQVYQFDVYYNYYGSKQLSLILITQPEGENYYALQMENWPPTNIKSIPLKNKSGTISTGPVYIGDTLNKPEQKKHYFYPILIETDILDKLYNKIPKADKICFLTNLNDIYKYIDEKTTITMPKQGGTLVDFNGIRK